MVGWGLSHGLSELAARMDFHQGLGIEVRSWKRAHHWGQSVLENRAASNGVICISDIWEPHPLFFGVSGLQKDCVQARGFLEVRQFAHRRGGTKVIPLKSGL